MFVRSRTFDLGVDTANGKVHQCQPPSGVVGFLAVDGYLAADSWADLGFLAVTVAGGMGLNEFGGLDEHTARAAARVEDTAFVRFEHLDEGSDDALGRVELSAEFAFSGGELSEEVFVHPAKNITLAGGLVAQADGGDQVDDLAESSLVEGRAGVVLGQHTLENLVVAFDGGHRVVNERAYLGTLGVFLEIRPAGLGWHPEDIVGKVFVLVLGIREFIILERREFLHESVGDVFQEDQAEDDMLVFSGVHVAPKLIRRSPKFVFKSKISGGNGFRFGHGQFSSKLF